MTSKDEVDAQSNGSGPKTVDEIVDIKQPKNETGTAQLVTAKGNTQEVTDAGDFMAKLNAGNIVIDPVLAEKAVKDNLPPPLTIAEALERGDFQALARMMQAQIARAENGDLDGMRYEDAQRYANRSNEKEALDERVRDRERELAAFFDGSGGYHDRYGGYYNPNQGTYTDEDGGTVDNYGGYRYKNGNYKSKSGDFYEAKTNSVHLTTGEVVQVPKGVSGDEVIKSMQDDVKANGGYDPNFVRSSAMSAADSEHPSTTGNTAKVGGLGAATAREVSEKARANEGADTSNPNPASASSLKDRLAKLHPKGATASAPAAASTEVPVTAANGGQGQKPPESRFSTGPAADTSRGSDAEVTSSSFFAVDSSISASKFPAPKKDAVDAEAPDPVVTANTNTTQRPAAKSPAP